jgi:hypothetical protein
MRRVCNHASDAERGKLGAPVLAALQLKANASERLPITLVGASVPRCVCSQDGVNINRNDLRRASSSVLVQHDRGPDAVLKHGDALHPHTEGEALPFPRIDADIGQHAWMHHPAAKYL